MNAFAVFLVHVAVTSLRASDVCFEEGKPRQVVPSFERLVWENNNRIFFHQFSQILIPGGFKQCVLPP